MTLASAPFINLVIPGGVLRQRSWSLSGPSAENAMRDLQGNTLFLGVDRRDPEVGGADDAARARGATQRADDPQHRAQGNRGDGFVEAAPPEPVGDLAGEYRGSADRRQGGDIGCFRDCRRALFV